MKQISIQQLNENFIESIGKEWMLVTAGNSGKFNTMTASWGGIGYLWNKPVVFVFIRPERYTFEFIESHPDFTLSFLGKENQGIHKVTGFKSGREIDKIAATGLKPLVTENGNVAFEQSRLTLECKKLYSDDMKTASFLAPELIDRWYGESQGNLHRIYVAEIIDAWVKE